MYAASARFISIVFLTCAPRAADAFNDLLAEAYILDACILDDDGHDAGPRRCWAGQFAAYIPTGSASRGVRQMRGLRQRRPVVRLPGDRSVLWSGHRHLVRCAAASWGVGSQPQWVERGACPAPAAALRGDAVRLLRLSLPSYRGLHHFELDLTGALDGGHAIATLIGPNGGGKSRALHALAEIFGALHRPGHRAPFAFELDYEVHDRTVRVVQTSPDTSPELTVSTSLG